MSRSALARLRRLPTAATALARAVVILGDGAEPALAAALAEIDPETASHAADALEEAAILTSRGTRMGSRGGRRRAVAGRGVAAGGGDAVAGWGVAAGGGDAVAGWGVEAGGGDAVAGGVADRGAGAGAIVGGVADRGVAGAGTAAGGDAVPLGGRRLSFVHRLVRESVYAELSAGDRARGHARAAKLLTAAGADAERVAIHRHEGDPAGDPEAARVLREAAASARPTRGDRGRAEPPAPGFARTADAHRGGAGPA